MIRARLGQHAPTFVLALAGIAVLSVLGLTGFAFTDYDNEAAPAFLALLNGDVGRFLELCPAYGGSLVLRAPFALVPTLWGGEELAAFRAGALPGLIACAVLATVVVGRMRAAARPRVDRAVVLVLLTASPVAMQALDYGHPEELLGAALCVAAVLSAPGRPLLAGLLLGLAVANKPWALIAAPVVLATLPAGRRIRPVALAVAVTLVVLAPLLAGSRGQFVEATTAARDTGTIVQPWQAWYLLGEEGNVVRSINGGVRELRYAPGWLTQANRPLILLAAALLTFVWWRRREHAGPADPLLLLALVFHVRCLIDPWNFSYYALPALMALAAWEGLDRPRRAPMLSLLYVVGIWQSFEVARERLAPDLLSVLYVGWAVPLALLLGAMLFIRPVRLDTFQEALQRADAPDASLGAKGKPLVSAGRKA